jgi:iron-sulfur cluster repair protein YtfE (RIC family)
MKNPVESLLEADHESLGQLLDELDEELSKPEISRAFELLDLFWARLAVHIRAENLGLFPALTSVPATSFTGRNGLPTSDEAQDILVRLRSDHDFFMKELALMMKTARKLSANELSPLEQVNELRRRLVAIKQRLENHNRLEEEQVYGWPGLIFDELSVAKLCQLCRHELGKLPPRFS